MQDENAITHLSAKSWISLFHVHNCNFHPSSGPSFHASTVTAGGCIILQNTLAGDCIILYYNPAAIKRMAVGEKSKPRGTSGIKDTDLRWRMLGKGRWGSRQLQVVGKLTISHAFLIQFGLSHDYGYSAFQRSISICCVWQPTAETTVWHPELPAVKIFCTAFMPSRD